MDSDVDIVEGPAEPSAFLEAGHGHPPVEGCEHFSVQDDCSNYGAGNQRHASASDRSLRYDGQEGVVIWETAHQMEFGTARSARARRSRRPCSCSSAGGWLRRRGTTRGSGTRSPLARGHGRRSGDRPRWAEADRAKERRPPRVPGREVAARADALRRVQEHRRGLAGAHRHEGRAAGVRRAPLDPGRATSGWGCRSCAACTSSRATCSQTSWASASCRATPRAKHRGSRSTHPPSPRRPPPSKEARS